MTSVKPIQVGIIGAGRIAKVHARNLAYRIPGVQLTSVADVHLDAAENLAAEFQIPNYFKHYQDLLDQKNLDAVIICSSTATHSEISIQAAKAMKHIFCEKPIDLDLNKIQEVLSIVSRQKVLLQVGFNRRFDPSFYKVATSVRANKIGKPHLIRISSRDPEPPSLEYLQSSGGLFLDMMIHDFDMARNLAGSEVKEVYATGDTLIHPSFKEFDDVDTAIVILTFKNGVICTIDNSRKSVYGYDQRIEVFGSDGCFIVDNTSPYNMTLWNQEGGKKERPYSFFIDRYQEAFFLEMTSFIESIQFNQPTQITGHDGLQAVLIGLAAKKSLNHKRPVQLEEISA